MTIDKFYLLVSVGNFTDFSSIYDIGKIGKEQILFVCIDQQMNFVKVIWALACCWSTIYCRNG
jgi:hypothetical protein